MASQTCPFCQSANRREFPAEINIHFPGMEGLTKTTVWVFPRLSVCMDCGGALFTVAEAELEQLDDSRGQSYRAAGIAGSFFVERLHRAFTSPKMSPHAIKITRISKNPSASHRSKCLQMFIT